MLWHSAPTLPPPAIGAAGLDGECHFTETDGPYCYKSVGCRYYNGQGPICDSVDKTAVEPCKLCCRPSQNVYYSETVLAQHQAVVAVRVANLPGSTATAAARTAAATALEANAALARAMGTGITAGISKPDYDGAAIFDIQTSLAFDVAVAGAETPTFATSPAATAAAAALESLQQCDTFNTADVARFNVWVQSKGPSVEVRPEWSTVQADIWKWHRPQEVWQTYTTGAGGQQGAYAVRNAMEVALAPVCAAAGVSCIVVCVGPVVQSKEVARLTQAAVLP